MAKINNNEWRARVRSNVKKYRERVNASENLRQVYLKKHAEQNKKYRARIKQKLCTLSNKNMLELRRQKERERKRNYRAKKKLELGVQNKNISAYKTPQTFGKDFKKVKESLPETKEKKIEVISKILKTIDPKLRLSATDNDYEFQISAKNISNKLDAKTLEKVENFFCREDISRVSPNLKDKVKMKTGNKIEYVQKRHMMYTIREAFSIFLEDNPNEKIKISKFYELRPKFVLLTSDMPHDVCVCKYHANLLFLIETLNKNLKFPKTHKELLQEIVCSLESEECMMGLCENCKTIDLKYSVLPLKYDKTQKFSFKQWTTINGKSELMPLDKSTDIIISILENQLPFFKKHWFIKNIQQKYFDLKRTEVAENEIILQMDFAENFSITAQDEIQSAHWSHNQVTIFTAVAWLHNKMVSFAIVSDYLSHDRYAVNVFLKTIMDFLNAQLKEFAELCIFSDGCAAQFKNRYTLSSICFLTQEMDLTKMEWNFFASSHGKGAVDGIGATVKRKVWTEIKSRKFLVNNAEDFYKCAQKIEKVNIIFVKSDEVEATKSKLDEKWKLVKGIPNVASCHNFKYFDNSHIEVKKVSNSKESNIVLCFPF